MNHNIHKKNGFTLIETALALLAISIGLLGIFGLARHGLQAGSDVENETRCTLLANTVFETLKAKNDELAARKVSLYDWWAFWLALIPQTSQASLYLPSMPEISENNAPVGISVGTHEMNDFLQTTATFTELKWNPRYSLTLDLNGVDLTNTGQVLEAYERGQINVTLTLHPGVLQSGAEKSTYYTVLTYSGGLP